MSTIGVDLWLHGAIDEAQALIRLADVSAFNAGALVT